MADRIIDIRAYLDGEEDDPAPEGAFALWGAEGERSRFALPLWRIIYLAGGNRGAIGRVAQGLPGPLRPLVVLDLESDPARLDLSAIGLPQAGALAAPVLHDRAGDVVVYLGTNRESAWYLVVDGCAGRDEPLAARVREDILFLAGECAGLLFLRELDEEIS